MVAENTSNLSQDACFKMAAVLVEAEGMECTDPDEVCGHSELRPIPSLYVVYKFPVHLHDAVSAMY